MITKTKTTQQKTPNNSSNLVLKKGMLGKFVSQKLANYKKGKAKSKKPKKMMFFKQGLTDKKAKKKDELLKWKTKGKHKNRRMLKTSLLGEDKRKKL